MRDPDYGPDSLPRLGRLFADGADVVDHIIEIPLPGRTVASPTCDAPGHAAGVSLPSFVAGPENRLVAAAITRLMRDDRQQVQDEAPRAPTVWAFYGPSGSGKTHLARGLVRHWHDHHGPDSAEYLTAVDFRRALSAAIDGENVSELRDRIRGRLLLAIDDLHRLPDDDYLVEELRYTLDDLELAGGTVIVTSMQPAGTLANMPPDLRSRLSSGLVLQLAPPGTAARERLVRQVAAALGRPVSDEVAGRLANGLQGTASELFGAVFELLAAAPVNGMANVKQADRLLASRAARRPTLREITTVVAKYFRQPQAVLKSASRRQSAVLPRAVAVYLARELAGASYEQIGRALGGRDHTTIMHNYRKIDRQRQRDLAIQETLAELRRILLSG
jgi:chromosomal replication initiator protein